MAWKNLGPAIGAGLLGSAVFWLAVVLYLCGECERGLSGCGWRGSCLPAVGIPLAIVVVAVSLTVPFRLVEGRWQWQRGSGGE